MSIKRFFIFFMIFTTLLCSITMAQAAASKTINVSFSVDTYQSRANSVIKEINEYRRDYDLPQLITTADLEKIAVQRAAELFVLFDHTRPDMTDYTSIINEYKSLYGWYYANELIAAGYSKADEVTAEWILDNADILLDEDYTHIGVACITVDDSENEYYWCAFFLQAPDDYNGKAVASTKAGQAKNVKVSIDSAMFSHADNTHKRFELRVNNITLKSKTAQPTVYLYDKFDVKIGKVDPAQGLTYKSSNTKVFTVSSDGELKKGKAGEATLTVRFPNLDDATCIVTTSGSSSSGTSSVTGGVTASSIGDTAPEFSAKSYTNHTTLSAYLKGASGYVLYRSTTKNGSYTKVDEEATTKKWTVKLLHEDLSRTYYYKVRAYKNSNGKRVYSEYSEALKVSP